MVKILLTGSSGRLGSELKKLYPKAICPTVDDMDIIFDNEVADYIRDKKPDIIIHCAANTDVSMCEREPFGAYLVNSLGTYWLSQETEFVNTKLVYISTDHVFDGEKGYYKETDTPNPTTVYGKSKLMGEWFTLANPKNLVIRTSFMKDFPFEKAYTDKFFNAEKVEVIAKMIKQAIDMNLTGLYHIAGRPKNVFYLAQKLNPKVKPMKLNDRPCNDAGLKYLKDTTMDIRKWENAKRTYRRKHKL